MVHVVYSDSHKSNHPTDQVDGFRGYWEVPDRIERIKIAIEQMGLNFLTPQKIDPSVIAAVHDQGLLDHLQTAFELSRKDSTGEQPYLAHTFAVRGRRVSPSDHPGPGAFGSWAFDTSAPVFRRTWQATVQACECAVTAADITLQTNETAYSLARPPGHHAGRDFYGGFCYINHCAVAAEYLQQKTKFKIATLDFDYHHGNGTQEIFYQNGDVLTCSIHADPKQDYPFYWGSADEIGDGPGENANLNIPLPIGTKDSDYLPALDRVLEKIALFQPKALVVSAGFDLMAGDPVVREGGFRITVKGLKAINRKIASLKIPTVIIQEGGYNLDRLGEYAVTMLEEWS